MNRVYFSRNHMLLVAALSHVLEWPILRTYALLLWTANYEFKVHLTQKQMAAELGYSERAIRIYLNKLRELGLLKTWRGPDGGNYYRLLFPLPDGVVISIKEKISGYQPETKPQPQAAARPNDEEAKRRVDEALRRQSQAATAPTQELSATTDLPCPGENTDKLSEDSDEPSEPVNSKALHPEIAKIVEAVKRGGVSGDNPTVQFFTHLGFLAKDEFDEESLAQWLIDREASDFQAFCNLREKFIADPKSISRTELISLPMFSTETGRPISLIDYLSHETRNLCHGGYWLENKIGSWNIDYDLKRERREVEIRRRLEDFMRENGLQSLEDAIAAAKRYDEDVLRKGREERHSTNKDGR